MTREEFSRYVARNYHHLLRFVRSRIRNTADAEDVVQQTLLRLLMICDLIHAECPDGFVFTALRNAIVDHWRRHGRHPATGPLPPDVAEADLTGVVVPESAATEQRCRDVLREAQTRLTPREHRAFAVYWKHYGDRMAVLAELRLTHASKAEKYRMYDGPLYHARRKLGLELLPHAELLAAVGYRRVWELMYEELCGSPPGAAPQA